MYQAVRFDGEGLLVNHTEYLKKHNIVYETPAYKGCDGLPIGNGDMGGMLYHTKNAIVLPLNKTDVIDFAPDGNFDAWSWQSEENNTAPVSCGKITITDSMPSFDWLYLEKYSETLSLGEGVVRCESKTPFSSYDYRVFASKEYKLIAFEITATSAEEVEREITLEKWSTINVFHGYEQIKPVYDKNLFNVAVGADKNTAYLEQQLNGTHYITAVRVTGGECKAKVLNGRAVSLILEKSKKQSFTVLVTVVTSHEGKAKLNDALKILDNGEKNMDRLYEAQRKAWAAFWSKSLVSLPCDDYLENIYYMNLYQLGSCSLGKYPVTFAGLWGWYGDTRNWGHFYHWNHQQTYWGVYACGHSELAENYLNYRFNMLENAKADAKKLFGSENGAFYSDISNLNGYSSLEPDTVRNLTVGAQIALDFYRHYQYTMDEAFLRQRALPVMKAAAALYLDLLQEDEDGVYRIKGGSTCYESYWNMMETVTDFAAVKSLFAALEELGETGEAATPWFGHQYPTLTQGTVRSGSGSLPRGGSPSPPLYSLPTVIAEHNGKSLEVISAGTKWDGQKAATGEGDYPLSPFPLSELAAVYPSGYIGLSKRGTKEFEIALNTARLLFDMDVYASSKIGSSGHSVVLQTAARLGMREDCIKLLRLFVERYQQFPNGMTHFAGKENSQSWADTHKSRVLPLTSDKTEWESVHEKSEGNRVTIPTDDFVHCYFESAANIMTGVNEMLLQSHDGIMRVFPAVEKDYTAMFTLHAVNGFTVTSEIARGDIRYVHIKSGMGGCCKLESPWPDAKISVTSSGKSVSFVLNGGIAGFETQAGKKYLITRAEFPLDVYYREKIKAEKNTEPKGWRGKILGQYSLTKGRKHPL